MRFFSKAAAAAAAAGIAVIGTVAAGGGVASAATSQPSTGCTTGAVALEVGVLPSCTAGGGTAVEPTGFTVTASTSTLEPGLLSTLQTLLAPLNSDTGSTLLSTLTSALTENVSFTLSCVVNGQTVTQAETFNGLVNGQSKTISLQSAVGSPTPNSCQVQDFTVTSPISVSALDLALINGLPTSVLSGLTGILGGITGLNGVLPGLGLGDLNDLLSLSVGAQVSAVSAVPGAIWLTDQKTSTGFAADTCADDRSNGNAGSVGQVYQCNSDLAQSWTQSSTGELVHNGVCLTQNGSAVKLAACSATNKAQVWDVKGTGGTFAEIVNSSSGDCLTASANTDGLGLTGAACASKADQKWTGPAKSAA